MARELDIILFGATGFTGKHAIPILSKLSKANNRHLTWGIAGRSESKLKQVLAEYGTSESSIPVIIADVGDEKSLIEMARKARIIINCVGPYRFYGEPVVKACVDEATHYVDITAEPQFMEKMALKYHKDALDSVETYLDGWEEDSNLPGMACNYGTWESLVYWMAHTGELKTLRKQLYQTRVPSFKPKLKQRKLPHKNNLVEGWMIPYIGSDRSVMRRSQRFFYETEKQRPVQVETYILNKSLFSLIVLSFFYLILFTLARFKSGVRLLLKYPKIFTAGKCNRKPPKEEQINKSWFSVTLYGEGWKEKLSSPDNIYEYNTPTDKAVCVKVKGHNPAYGTTNKCLVLASIKVLTETDRLPGKGGVLPPGYAFAKTSLIEELDENEVTFEVLFEKELKANHKM